PTTTGMRSNWPIAAGSGSPWLTWTAPSSVLSGAPPPACCATSTVSWPHDRVSGRRLYHCRMSFFAILFALLLEQVRPLARHNPIHAALRSWARWASRNFDAGKTHHGWVAWTVAVILPSAAAAGVYWLLALTLGWPLAGLLSGGVLCVTLGFLQFSHHFTSIRDALDAGDEAAARELLAQWQQVDAGELPRSE